MDCLRQIVNTNPEIAGLFGRIRIDLDLKMVGSAEFEPATNWLKAHGSVTEIPDQAWRLVTLNQFK